MRDIITITKAISDETRLRALMALTGGELCVCQLVELLALAPSTVSKHLHILHSARLVDARKDGRWVYYTIAGRDAPLNARRCIKWLRSSLKESVRVAEDDKRLLMITATDKTGTCK